VAHEKNADVDGGNVFKNTNRSNISAASLNSVSRVEREEKKTLKDRESRRGGKKSEKLSLRRDMLDSAFVHTALLTSLLSEQ
jgi:hypothetical protein